MARHDETTERRHGLFTDPDLGGDESWPDAPEPSWLSDSSDDGHDDDAIEDPWAQTQTIPAFDLGANTESVVVDLTGPMPAVHTSPPVDPAPLDDIEPAWTASRHAAPAEPAAPFTPYVREEEPHRDADWRIPLVPEGSNGQGAESLTAATVLRSRRARPQTGWRKHVLNMSG
ncbi:MAG TPA: hypothetical protein VF227_08985, partial [Actinomycetes bacterium]